MNLHFRAPQSLGLTASFINARAFSLHAALVHTLSRRLESRHFMHVASFTAVKVHMIFACIGFVRLRIPPVCGGGRSQSRFKEGIDDLGS